LSEEGHEFPRRIIRYAVLGLKDSYYQAQSLGFAITVVSVLRLAQGVLTQLDL